MGGRDGGEKYLGDDLEIKNKNGEYIVWYKVNLPNSSKKNLEIIKMVNFYELKTNLRKHRGNDPEPVVRARIECALDIPLLPQELVFLFAARLLFSSESKLDSDLLIDSRRTIGPLKLKGLDPRPPPWEWEWPFFTTPKMKGVQPLVPGKAVGKRAAG